VLAAVTTHSLTVKQLQQMFIILDKEACHQCFDPSGWVSKQQVACKYNARAMPKGLSTQWKLLVIHLKLENYY